MRLLLAGVLIAAASAASPTAPTLLVDEVFTLAPNKAGAVHLNLQQRVATIRCIFEVKDGADVRPIQSS